MLPKRVERIIERLRQSYGELTPTLILENELRGHLTYRFDAADGKQYVLKVLGENFGIKGGIQKEVTNREILNSVFQQAGVHNYVITRIIEFDTDENWSLAEFETFWTLYDLYKADRVEFRRVVLELYETILIPLLRQLPAKTEVPGDYSLNDIGYRDDVFYFYDLEKNKTLLQVVVDVYGKLIHLYAKRQQAGADDAVAFLAELIDEVRLLQASHVDPVAFNETLKTRLESPVLRDAIGDRTPELLERFRIVPVEISYGVVPIQYVSGQAQALLIKNRGGHWSFPKGHPEGDETGIETARRELREETGVVDCDIDASHPFVERFRYERNGTNIDREITFYLGIVTSDSVEADPNKAHEFVWLPFDKAFERLTYPDSKQVLRNVVEYLERDREVSVDTLSVVS